MMAHAYLTDHDRERISLYVLDNLELQERETFVAHLETGCALCTEELRQVEETVGWMGYQADPVAPPRSLRQRLLDEVIAPSEEAAPGLNPAFMWVRADEGEWVDLGPGMSIKRLFHDPVTQRDTALVRMAAGTQLPPHRHQTVEELYVLEGDCHIAPGVVLRPGDYFRAEAGSVHELTLTEEGTTFLALYAVEFLA